MAEEDTGRVQPAVRYDWEACPRSQRIFLKGQGKRQLLFESAAEAVTVGFGVPEEADGGADSVPGTPSHGAGPLDATESEEYRDAYVHLYNDYLVVSREQTTGGQHYVLCSPFSLLSLYMDPMTTMDSPGDAETDDNLRTIRLVYGDYLMVILARSSAEREAIKDSIRNALTKAARITIGRLVKSKSRDEFSTTTFERAQPSSLNQEADCALTAEEKKDVDQTIESLLSEVDDSPEYYQVPDDPSQIDQGAKKSMLVSEGQEQMVLQFVESELLLMAGTRGKLLEYLTSTRARGYLCQAPKRGMMSSFLKRKVGVGSLLTQTTDQLFQGTFLLTYRLHMTPNELLDNIRERFEDPPIDISDAGQVPEDVVQSNANECRAKMLQVLIQWINNYWHDFELDEKLGASLEEFLDEVREHGYPQYAKKCEARIQAAKLKWETAKALDVAPPQRDKDGPVATFLLTADAKQLAMQITLFDVALFRRIAPVEYLNHISKDKGTDTAVNGQTYTQNLDRLISRFDQESNWVAAEVAAQEGDKDQAIMIGKFVDVAQHCLGLRNLYSAFAIIGALSFPKVRHLKGAWERVSKKHHKLVKQFEDTIMNPSRNMKHYRDVVAKFQRKKVPVLPFLPVFLKDLYFMNEGNAGVVEAMINFDKLRMLARLVEGLRSRTEQSYAEQPDKGWQAYLHVACVKKRA